MAVGQGNPYLQTATSQGQVPAGGNFNATLPTAARVGSLLIITISSNNATNTTYGYTPTVANEFIVQGRAAAGTGATAVYTFYKRVRFEGESTWNFTYNGTTLPANTVWRAVEMINFDWSMTNSLISTSAGSTGATSLTLLSQSATVYNSAYPALVWWTAQFSGVSVTGGGTNPSATTNNVVRFSADSIQNPQTVSGGASAGYSTTSMYYQFLYASGSTGSITVTPGATNGTNYAWQRGIVTVQQPIPQGVGAYDLFSRTVSATYSPSVTTIRGISLATDGVSTWNYRGQGHYACSSGTGVGSGVIASQAFNGNGSMILLPTMNLPTSYVIQVRCYTVPVFGNYGGLVVRAPWAEGVSGARLSVVAANGVWQLYHSTLGFLFDDYVSTGAAVGDILRVRVNGNAYSLYVNSRFVGTWTDTNNTLPAGNNGDPGLLWYPESGTNNTQGSGSYGRFAVSPDFTPVTATGLSSEGTTAVLDPLAADIGNRNLSGSGTVANTNRYQTYDQPVPANMTGTGATSAQVLQNVFVSGSLSGSGTLSAVADRVEENRANAALKSTGTLSAAIAKKQTTSTFRLWNGTGYVPLTPKIYKDGQWVTVLPWVMDS